MESHALIHIQGVPPFVTYSWLAMIILITVAFIVRGSLKLVPVGTQNVAEGIVEALYDFCKDNINHHWVDSMFPMIGTLGLYILTCNLMGLIPGFEAPTSDINMTASCAIPVFLATHYFGLREHGGKYINQFLGPVRSIYAIPLMIMMFVIEFIGHLARPVTLSVRLFGNMLSKHIILSVLGLLAPAVIPIVFLGLGILVSVVQAFVFVLLTTLYFAGAVDESH
ncbi:MAG: F0F1 ATP synthase subunit A [Nitrospirae bacterium]|nr:F0F1 ATP synthase subunit A [Nitrospirota bacterium]MBF0534913.1 F0F1 ATP synthase subunit A [Nitrospirota bacterium]MBF0616828.1 F0F1 ATP synthase subunit A [Nitrospirota bacterium]